MTQQHATYKRSQYIFTVPCDNGIMLIFNAFSKAIGRFSREQIKVVKSILSKPAAPVSHLPQGVKIKKYLLQNGFILPGYIDEAAALKERNHAGISSQNCFDLILLPTMDCNFNCFYCFENHRAGVMKPEIQDRIKKWGQKTVPVFKNLNLSWFGGEPLLCPDIIAELSGFFKDLCKRNNTGFYNIITTNGYLLSREIVDLLKNAGIKTFNITVDGPPIWHNRFRTHKADFW